MSDELTLENLLPLAAQPPQQPLQLMGVADRGVPGKERIYLKVNGPVILAEYLLLLGWKLPNNDGFPLHDHSFWFGHHIHSEGGHWIVIYTGPGPLGPVSTKITGTNQPASVFYWGKQLTVLNDVQVIPILLHIDVTGIQIGR